MTAAPDQIYFLLGGFGLTILLSLLHILRTRITMAPFFGLAGVYSMMQWQLLQTGWWVNIGPFNFNAGLSIFIPALLLGSLLTFALDGLRTARAYSLVVLTTSIAAWSFSLFRELLSQYVPLPYLIVLSNKEHMAIILAIVLAQLGSVAAYIPLQSRIKWLALPVAEMVGLFNWLLIYSLLNYGLEMGISNIRNELATTLISGWDALLLGTLYAAYAAHQGLLMPQRSLKALLALWRPVESDQEGRQDDSLNRDKVVSELRLLNKSLQQNSRVMETHMEHAAYGILITDAKGRILQSNQQAARLFGQANLDGEEISPLLHRLTRQHLSVTQLADAPVRRWKTQQPDSSDRWLEFIVTALAGESIGPDGPFYLIVKDVSADLLDERRRLVSNRIKDIHQTGRVLAHDFSNLLIGAEAQVGKLKRLEPDSEAREALNGIAHALRRSRDLLKQIGAGSQFGTPKLAPLNLSSLLQEAVAICTGSAEKEGIQLRLAASPPWKVEADASQLVRVFTNLIKNAIRASTRGDIIHLHIESRGGGVEVVIADEGTGMSDAALRAAFDPGYSSKGEGKGGLGLAISYLMIDAHGGQLELRHNPAGHGVEAVIWLPAGQGERPAPDFAGLANPDILLLHDRLVVIMMPPSATASALIEQMEQQQHCQIAEVQNAEEALALIADEPEWDTLIVENTQIALPWLGQLPATVKIIPF